MVSAAIALLATVLAHDGSAQSVQSRSNLIRSTELVGHEVDLDTSRGGAEGEIVDVLVNMREGRAKFAVIRDESELGGETLMSVPVEDLRQDGGEIALTGNASSLRWVSGFDENRWPSRSGVRWNPDESDQPREGARLTASSSLRKASELAGMEVENWGGEDLGEFEDMVIDLDTGRVVYGILAAGGFLEMGEDLFAIGIDKFRYNAARGHLVLAADEEDFENAQGIGDRWPTSANERWNRLSEDYTYDDDEWFDDEYGYDDDEWFDDEYGYDDDDWYDDEYAYDDDYDYDRYDDDYGYDYDRYDYDRYDDRYGYDRYGYDRYGYDRYGYDRYGYDRYGYDRYGARYRERDRREQDRYARDDRDRYEEEMRSERDRGRQNRQGYAARNDRDADRSRSQGAQDRSERTSRGGDDRQPGVVVYEWVWFGTPAEDFDAKYRPDQAFLKSGTVKSVSRTEPEYGDGSRCLTMKLEEGDGTVTKVHLGPAWNAEQEGFELNKGDEVVVNGSLARVDGEQVLVAGNIKNRDTNRSMTLFDAQGRPTWSSSDSSARTEGSGRSPRSDDRGASRDGAGAEESLDEFTRAFEQGSMTEVRGTIRRIVRESFGSEPELTGIVVDTNDGRTLKVHLGPASFVEDQDLGIRRDGTVNVKGSEARVDGEPVLIATVVEIDDDRVRLRRDDGTALWSDAEQRSGSEGL